MPTTITTQTSAAQNDCTDPCGICGFNPRCPFPYEEGYDCDNCGAVYTEGERVESDGAASK